MFVDVAEVLARGETPEIVFALKTLLADDLAVDAEPLALHLVTHAEPALRGEALHTLGLLAERGRIIELETVIAAVHAAAADADFYVSTRAHRAAVALRISLDEA